MNTRKESPFLEYELLENVGDGSFGSVHKARKRKTNEIVAIKVMKKKFNSYSECNNLKEYKTLKKMSNHPNIVQLFETYLGPTKEFYFIMEYMNGGNLYQFINERKESNQIISLNEIKTILRQILSALSHIHQIEGIFHRDMKPENLLIAYHNNNEIIIKLADFGLAADIKKITITPYTDYVSTRWYRAPEVLLKSSNYSFPIDLWAVGTIFAELITLKPLFPGQSEIDQLFRICKVLGSPYSTTTTTTAAASYSKQQSQRKSYSNFIIPSKSNITHDSIGIGGEWKEGIKLSHKMGFEFPKISPKIESLSTVLQPNSISNDGIDLLSKLLRFDPCKRITSLCALSHPFFMPTLGNNDNTSLEPILTSIAAKDVHTSVTSNATTTTTTLFDLPIIPLSPFQLEEEYSRWDLLMKNSSPAHKYSQDEQQQNHDIIPLLTRTTSFPNILYNDKEVHHCFDSTTTNHQQVYKNSHPMQRSLSDLSIPTNKLPPPSNASPQKKKTTNRLSLWAKKYIIV